MIRLAREEDRQAVARVWAAGFGDPNEYIGFFMRNCFAPENCLLSLDAAGRPAAAVHLLPAEYADAAGRIFPVQYFYAAATLPEYRRQGRMAELIERADSLGRERGRRFTCLLPASPALYSYYGAHGYSGSFFAKHAMMTRARLGTIAGPALPARAEPAGMEALLRARRERFSPAVLWGRDMFAYVLGEWKFGGGDLLTFEGGYCLCLYTGGRVLVKELCAAPDDWPGVAALLLERYASDRFEFHLPPDSDLIPGAEKVPCGMLRPCGDAKGACDMSHAYINLLLD